jgi:hypothetical protein
MVTRTGGVFTPLPRNQRAGSREQRERILFSVSCAF